MIFSDLIVVSKKRNRLISAIRYPSFFCDIRSTLLNIFLLNLHVNNNTKNIFVKLFINNPFYDVNEIN